MGKHYRQFTPEMLKQVESVVRTTHREAVSVLNKHFEASIHRLRSMRPSVRVNGTKRTGARINLSEFVRSYVAEQQGAFFTESAKNAAICVSGETSKPEVRLIRRAVSQNLYLLCKAGKLKKAGVGKYENA